MNKIHARIFTLSILVIISLITAGCTSKDNRKPVDYTPIDNDEGNNDDVDQEKEDGNETDQTDNDQEDEDPDIEPEVEIVDSGIQLYITVDDDDIRVYDRVNFTVHDAPYGSNITWEFPEDTLYGYEVKYFFRSSDYFIVNVTAIWNNQFASGSLIVPVKNQDWDNYHIGSELNRLVLGTLSHSIGIPVTEGITIPEITISLELINFTGRLEIGISIVDTDENYEIIDTTILDSKETEGLNERQSFLWNISQTDLIPFEDVRPYSPSCFLEWIGYIGHVEYWMSFTIIY